MGSWIEARLALMGILRFARFDRRAVGLFDPSLGAAKRSFWACFYTLPFFFALVWLENLDAKEPVEDWLLLLAVHGIGFIAQSAALPLVILPLAGFLERTARWPLYVTTANWLGLVQMAVLAIVALVDYPASRGDLGFVLTLFFLLVEGFMAMVALECGALAAIVVVLADLFLGVSADNVVAALLP
jgi:hypothetical protein